MAYDIQTGTLIGAAGGAVAGLILWLVGRLIVNDLNKLTLYCNSRL